MEITAKTKLIDVLNEYPQLEEQIIQAAPAFKNLKNPILRRTVGRMATVEKVVQIGGLDLTTFINMLRRQVGQPELVPPDLVTPEMDSRPVLAEPAWIAGEAQFVVDGKAMLASGGVPVNRVNELLPQLEAGKFLLLITDFEPTPMIDAVKLQKREAYHKVDPLDPTRHLTYFR
ncbi:MAG TPA: DUF1858 domain-containing protein [Anaerolineaceae bacterium]|nr:DUF1858 domain-containing protein [Anaerolineaceae bacterium]